MSISKETLSLIGEFAVAYTDMQFFTIKLYESFGIGKSGFKQLNNSYHNLINKIRCYSEEVNITAEEKTELINLCDRLDKIRGKRNSFFHSVFVANHDGAESRFDFDKIKSSKEYKAVSLETKAISTLIDELDETSQTLMFLANKISKNTRT